MAPVNRRSFIIGGMCACVLALYTQRTTMSVSIVDITESLGWSDSEKDDILSAFYWGYTGAMIPSGVLVKKYGGHAMLVFAVGASSLLTMVVPWVASSSGGVGAVCFLRALTGIVEAACFPATYDVVSRWIPINEMSTAIGLGMAFGEQLGAVIGFGATGVLCDQVGWRSPFYVFGAFGALVTVIWGIFCSRDPASDTWISEGERGDILAQRPATETDDAGVSRGTLNEMLLGDGVDQPNSKGPSRVGSALHNQAASSSASGVQILITAATSPALWPVYLCHFANNWTSYTLISEFPSFLTSAHDYSLSNAGFALVAMYICQSLGSGFGGVCADRLIRGGGIITGDDKTRCIRVDKTRSARVLFGEIAMLGSATLLVLATYQPRTLLLVVLMCAAVAFLGCGSGAWRSSFVDLAPTHSSAAYTVSNTLANMTGILTPLITTVLTSAKSHRSFGWHAVFVLSACINLLAGMSWWIFVTTKPIEGL